jgi:hypothetical protein
VKRLLRIGNYALKLRDKTTRKWPEEKKILSISKTYPIVNFPSKLAKKKYRKPPSARSFEALLVIQPSRSPRRYRQPNTTACYFGNEHYSRLSLPPTIVNAPGSIIAKTARH